MKDIIDSLNLPKQILEKTEELLKTLFGPATKEVGELFADKVRYRRLKNQDQIFHKTVSLLEKNNLKPKELNLKTLVPLIEECSLEEDELLQEKWSNLLANLATSPENGLEAKLVKTLSNLTPLEAQILDFAYNQMQIGRDKLIEQRKRWKGLFDEEEIKSIKIDEIIIDFNEVKKHFTIDSIFLIISIENLALLGLLKYEEPEITIDDNSSSGEIVEDKEKERKIELELDVSASYSQSNNFRITHFGGFFMRL